MNRHLFNVVLCLCGVATALWPGEKTVPDLRLLAAVGWGFAAVQSFLRWQNRGM